jgi:hypothetical protein
MLSSKQRVVLLISTRSNCTPAFLNVSGTIKQIFAGRINLPDFKVFRNENNTEDALVENTLLYAIS